MINKHLEIGMLFDVDPSGYPALRGCKTWEVIGLGSPLFCNGETIENKRMNLMLARPHLTDGESLCFCTDHWTHETLKSLNFRFNPELSSNPIIMPKSKVKKVAEPEVLPPSEHCESSSRASRLRL